MEESLNNFNWVRKNRSTQNPLLLFAQYNKIIPLDICFSREMTPEFEMGELIFQKFVKHPPKYASNVIKPSTQNEKLWKKKSRNWR